MENHRDFAEIVLSVLGYPEDDEWVALALEMDVRGYGATFEEALDELFDLIMMQVSFAHFKKQPEMIWKPADPVWFELFAEERQSRMRSLSRKEENGSYRVRGLPLPPPHVIAELMPEFAQADA